MDNRYKGLSKENLEVMLRITQEAFNMIITAIFRCKWSKEEEKVLLNAQRILDYRTDRIKQALGEKGFASQDLENLMTLLSSAIKCYYDATLGYKPTVGEYKDLADLDELLNKTLKRLSAGDNNAKMSMQDL